MKSAFFGLHGHSFSKNPILVIDRSGLIGEQLSKKLSKEFLVVLVSGKKIETEIENKNIIHIPFFKRFPAIPDNKYSQIIFIDAELRDLELLPKLIKKSRDVNAEFIFAQELSLSGEYAVSQVVRLDPTAKIILFGDIFDDKLILKKNSFKSTINKFLFQAQKFGKIQILGEGLKASYPVFLQDIVNSFIDLIFGLHKSQTLFYVFPKHPPTELSLAHMVQKANPEIVVDFVKIDPRKYEIKYPAGGKYLLEDRYPLTKKIREIDINKKVKEHGSEMGWQNKKIKNFPHFVFWVLMFLLFSPFIFSVIFSFLGFNTFFYAEKELSRGNIYIAKSSLHLSQTLFYLGKKTSGPLFFEAKIIGQESAVKSLVEDIGVGHKISQGLLSAIDSGVYFSKVLNGSSGNPSEDFINGENYLKNSIILLNKAKAEKKISAQIFQTLESISPLTNFLSDITGIMPSIFGMGGEKTYLVLLQNNLELRPGGGAINSYGILKLNRGKIVNFSLHPVADADSKLRGHIEPPFPLRRYLSEKHWYLRDSNFDIDFAKSASSSSNFLFVETGQKIDGVIAADASFVKSLLRVVGEVYVPEFGKKINENNIYALAESVEQNKDFLKPVTEAIVKSMSEKKISYFLIAQVISDALIEKHLLSVLNNESQKVFTVNGWSSALWDERVGGEQLVNDFLGINEANLGLNKIENYIKRQVSQSVLIENDGSVSEELTINYKNEGKSNYKNYLRIILPKNTDLQEISINGDIQKNIKATTDPLIYEAKNFKAPAGLEIEQTNEGDKTVFGFLTNVPSRGISQIKIKYVLRGSIFGVDNFSYNLKLFKQPGVDSVPYSFFFSYPSSMSIVKSSDGIIVKKGNASFSKKITQDKSLTITLSKNQ